MLVCAPSVAPSFVRSCVCFCFCSSCSSHFMCFLSPACSRRSRCASGDPKPLPHLRRRRALQQTTEERHNRLSLREKTRPCLSNKPMCFSPLSLPAAGRAGGPLACLQGMARISRQAFFPSAAGLRGRLSRHRKAGKDTAPFITRRQLGAPWGPVWAVPPLK